ncbi:preprotein translocase subunit SecE, partial [Lacticaseibacillus rhamnosus]
TRRDTFTVIMTSIIFAIYFAGVDWVINAVFQAFLY